MRLSLFLALALSPVLAGCCDGDERVESEPRRVDFASGGAKVSRCAPAVTEVSSGSSCTLAYEELRSSRCPGGGPGGGEVSASGVTCAVARQLRLPAGAGPAIRYGDGVQEAIYRPWLARGSFSNPVPERAIGWTCFKRFDPRGGGVRHLCWNEDGGIIRFTVS